MSSQRVVVELGYNQLMIYISHNKFNGIRIGVFLLIIPVVEIYLPYLEVSCDIK